MALYQFPRGCSPMGSIQPLMRDLFIFGIINSGSIETFVPRPSQVVQAPNGELKENARGCSSSNEISHWGQEKNSLYKCSFLPISSMITSPLPTFRANSIEPVNLSLIPFFVISRSTNTSIVCLIFFSRSILPERFFSSPSIRTRTNPSWAIERSTSLNCPFRARTAGART